MPRAYRPARNRRVADPMNTRAPIRGTCCAILTDEASGSLLRLDFNGAIDLAAYVDSDVNINGNPVVAWATKIGDSSLEFTAGFQINIGDLVVVEFNNPRMFGPNITAQPSSLSALAHE